jgi:SCY1-like protein 2
VAIQEMSLSVAPSFMHAMEYGTLKNQLLPRIQALVVKSTRTTVTINGLVCIGKLLPLLDRNIVHESLLPMLDRVQNREPGVLMALLGIYDEVIGFAMK